MLLRARTPALGPDRFGGPRGSARPHRSGQTLLVAALAVAVAAGAFAALPSCTRGPKRAVQLKGSDTMVNLGTAWAEAFMAANPGMAVAVTGGGSGTGIAAVINGFCDAAQASRAMKPKEKAMAEALGRPVREYEVAIDCLAVVVHPENPLDSLTVEQIAAIYRGAVVNWSEVGGPDQPIDVFSRERNSGTHHYFLEEVVRLGRSKGVEQFAPGVAMMPSSQAIYDEVGANRRAIGYYGLGYLGPANKALAVAKGGKPAALPSVANALSKRYPIARPLFIYTAGEPDGALDAFLAFVLSDEGQRIALAEDFVPLRMPGEPPPAASIGADARDGPTVAESPR